MGGRVPIDSRVRIPAPPLYNLLGVWPSGLRRKNKAFNSSGVRTTGTAVTQPVMVINVQSAVISF